MVVVLIAETVFWTYGLARIVTPLLIIAIQIASPARLVTTLRVMLLELASFVETVSLMLERFAIQASPLIVVVLIAPAARMVLPPTSSEIVSCAEMVSLMRVRFVILL